jgi:hypothetical protein
MRDIRGSDSLFWALEFGGSPHNGRQQEVLRGQKTWLLK